MKGRNWSKLIEEQKQSGKTVSEFCKIEGVHYTSFYKNRQKLRQHHFIEIKIQEKQALQEQPLILKYKEFSLEIPISFNKQILKDFLSVLGEI